MEPYYNYTQTRQLKMNERKFMQIVIDIYNKNYISDSDTVDLKTWTWLLCYNDYLTLMRIVWDNTEKYIWAKYSDDDCPNAAE